MAEDAGYDPESEEAGQQDELVGKIDQLLHKHRPKSVPAEDLPVLTDAPAVPDASSVEDAPLDDGIPTLTDVVGATRTAAPKAPPPAPPAINSTLILRRLAMALEAEHARLRIQIGGDALQMRLLDRLIAELRRALPGAIRSALPEHAAPDSAPENPRSGEDRRL